MDMAISTCQGIVSTKYVLHLPSISSLGSAPNITMLHQRKMQMISPMDMNINRNEKAKPSKYASSNNSPCHNLRKQSLFIITSTFNYITMIKQSNASTTSDHKTHLAARRAKQSKATTRLTILKQASLPSKQARHPIKPTAIPMLIPSRTTMVGTSKERNLWMR